MRKRCEPPSSYLVSFNTQHKRSYLNLDLNPKSDSNETKRNETKLGRKEQQPCALAPPVCVKRVSWTVHRGLSPTDLYVHRLVETFVDEPARDLAGAWVVRREVYALHCTEEQRGRAGRTKERGWWRKGPRFD